MFFKSKLKVVFVVNFSLFTMSFKCKEECTFFQRGYRLAIGDEEFENPEKARNKIDLFNFYFEKVQNMVEKLEEQKCSIEVKRFIMQVCGVVLYLKGNLNENIDPKIEETMYTKKNPLLQLWFLSQK